MTVNFRKTLVSGLVAASLAAISAGTMAAANPVEVAVTFTGTILDNTCGTPTVVGGSAIEFGNISRANFTEVGAVGKEKVFQLQFTNCGNDAGNVDISFKGDDLAADQTSLANGTGEDDASGVGVKLLGGTDYGTTMTLNNDAAKARYSTLAVGGTSETPHLINLKAQVVQTSETTPSTGYLNTQGTLVVTYE
ncbi:fimbrial protein [Klebsiella oxytoca]|uniref:fimbrial protein n=1 Tax=Klebsiella oxytoca TaxID=571 RepID=UPI002930F9C2|nr:fimbrial protein [Klebsiella oxytoca]